jgi:hypothetical protein
MLSFFFNAHIFICSQGELELSKPLIARLIMPPMPCRSVNSETTGSSSNHCGSGDRASKLLAPTSSQLKFGGGGGMQVLGYDESHDLIPPSSHLAMIPHP